MDLCGVPKARPIVCNDTRLKTASPFSPLHSRNSVRFPWVIDTTFEEKIYMCCCIDLLNPLG
jgi:hypothetical protein